MTGRWARFEIVRTDAGWFSRFIAANGREVWRTSEVYRRRAGAQDALYQLGKCAPPLSTPWESALFTQRHGAVEVRHLDEREPRP